MTHSKPPIPGILVLCVLALGPGPARGDENLSKQLQEIDRMRKGPKTPFAKVESRAQDLLKKHTTPEEQGKIYYQIADAYGQSGLFDRERAQRLVEYAQKALEYPQEPVHRLELYVYWGDGIRAAGQREPFQPVRKAAAEAYLNGLKEARQYHIPEKPREIPPRSLFAGIPHGSPLTEQEFKRRSDELLATQEQARYEADLIYCRQVLVNQIVEIYTGKPYAATELRQLATRILEDSASVDALMKLIEEQGALKDDLTEEEMKEPPPEDAPWRWPLVVGVNALVAGAIWVVVWRLRRHRTSPPQSRPSP